MEQKKDNGLQAFEIFNKYAEEYAEKFMDVGLYRRSLDSFCDLLTKQDSKIFDIACGPGNIANYLLSRKPDLIVLGIDLAPNMVTLARQNNPGASFEVMDCRLIKDIPGRFDAVICAFCLPYLTQDETNKLFRDIDKLLNENGICYITTMEDEHSRSGYQLSSKGDQVFINYYKAEYLVRELARNNFAVVAMSRQTSPSVNGREIVDLIIICQKKTG